MKVFFLIFSIFFSSLISANEASNSKNNAHVLCEISGLASSVNYTLTKNVAVRIRQTKYPHFDILKCNAITLKAYETGKNITKSPFGPNEEQSKKWDRMHDFHRAIIDSLIKAGNLESYDFSRNKNLSKKHITRQSKRTFKSGAPHALLNASYFNRYV